MFYGLNSLKTLYLGGNHLTKLPRDVLSHLPRPLKLGFTYQYFECDIELCWLKQEEQQGTITFLSETPRCADGIRWYNWRCYETGRCLDIFPVG